MEKTFTGYCRVMDGARTVMAEYDDGWEIDCRFPGCTFAADCPIGRQLQSLTEKEEPT